MAKDNLIEIILFPGELYPITRSNIKDLFLEEFIRRGHKVHLICFSENVSNTTIYKQNNLTYHISPYPYNNIPYSIYRRYKSNEVKTVVENIIKQNNIDLLQVRDDLLDAKLCLKLRNKYDIPFSYHLSSLFYNFHKNMIKDKANIKHVFQYFRGLIRKNAYHGIISKCDIFMPISDYMLKFIEVDLADKPVLPLPIQASRSFLRQNVDWCEYEKHDRMIYVGQVSYIRRLDLLIDILNKVHDKINNIELWIVGPPQDKGVIQDLKRYAEKRSLLDNVKFFGEIEKNRIPELISRSNIGLSIIPPIKGYKVSSPTKTIEYLSVGIPAVVNEEIFDQKNIIDESGGGFSSSYNIDSISDRIIKLLRNKEKAYDMGEKGKKWLYENRSYMKKVEELENIFLKVIN